MSTWTASTTHPMVSLAPCVGPSLDIFVSINKAWNESVCQHHCGGNPLQKTLPVSSPRSHFIVVVFCESFCPYFQVNCYHPACFALLIISLGKLGWFWIAKTTAVPRATLPTPTSVHDVLAHISVNLQWGISYNGFAKAAREPSVIFPWVQLTRDLSNAQPEANWPDSEDTLSILIRGTRAFAVWSSHESKR